jgi:hypothetical protein
VNNLFLNKKIHQEEHGGTSQVISAINTPTTAFSTFSVGDFMGETEQNPNYDDAVTISQVRLQLNNETSLLLSFFKDCKFLSDKFTSHQFWLKHEIKLPYLSNLAMILLNIPCSSAFIERFFSICGVVCDKRRLNSDDQLIIDRSFLKVNIKLLNELTTIYEENVSDQN